jgi:Aspartyl protease
MPLSLNFEASHRYPSTDGIDIPVEVRVGNQRVELIARVDTGAAHCIFDRRYGEELGLEVESGRPQRFRTMTGSFVAYEH